MAGDKLQEVWLRGPLPGYPAALMPVAHSLLQSREEILRVATGATTSAPGYLHEKLQDLITADQRHVEATLAELGWVPLWTPWVPTRFELESRRR